MTKTQALVLAFIRNFIAEHGFSPSAKEIAAAVGVHESTASAAVTGLVERGFLIRKGAPRSWRNIQLRDDDPRARIAA